MLQLIEFWKYLKGPYYSDFQMALLLIAIIVLAVGMWPWASWSSIGSVKTRVKVDLAMIVILLVVLMGEVPKWIVGQPIYFRNDVAFLLMLFTWFWSWTINKRGLRSEGADA